MKKLQNNFTTPEQSKRLLELGVPADSADCYYYDWDIKGRGPHVFDWYDREISNFEKRVSGTKKYPCWSVGRLMEIIDICDTIDTGEQYPTTKQVKVICAMSYVEYMVKTIENIIEFREIDLNKIMEE